MNNLAELVQSADSPDEMLTIGLSDGPVNNTTVKPWQGTWDELEEKLQSPEIGEKNGRYFTCLPFTGDYRKGENAQGQTASVFVLDGDSRIDLETRERSTGAPDPRIVSEALKHLDITHCIYSSHSNGEKGNRYRVVIPCQCMGKDELEALVGWTIHKLHEAQIGLNPVSENLDVARAWFMPRVPDAAAKDAFEFYEHDSGKQFPKKDALEWYAEKRKHDQHQRPVSTGSTQGLLAAVTGGQPPTREKVEDALKSISPDCIYDDWLKALMAIHSTGTSWAFEVADEWSSRSEKHEGTDDVQKHWDSFTNGMPAGVTIGTLIHMAQDNGWKWPPVADIAELKARAESITSEDFDELRQLMRDITQLDALGIKLVKDTLCSRKIILKGEFDTALKDARCTIAKEAQASRVNTLIPLPQNQVKGVLPRIVSLYNYGSLYQDTKEQKDADDIATPLNTVQNWITLLKALGVSLWFNNMTRKPEVRDAGRYSLDVTDPEKTFPLLKDAGERNGLSKNGADELLNTIAYNSPYHPFEHYLHEVTWDGVDRIKQVVESIDTPDPEHLKMVLKPWLISTPAAVYGYGGNPPRGVLTFSGPQNIGKTGIFKRISPKGMFKEGVHLSLGNTSDRDNIINATNALIVELGEIDTTFRKSDISALKGFIGKAEDDYRAAYGRYARTYPRRTVYCGTVNEKEFLQDTTGNTRFWVVEITGIDFGAFNKIDIKQLWAQVKSLYDDGESWLLSRDQIDQLNAKNEEFRDKPQIEVALEDYYDWDDPEYVACQKKGFENLTKEQKKEFSLLSSQGVAGMLGAGDRWMSSNKMGKDMSQALKRLTGMQGPQKRRIPPTNTPKNVWVLPPRISLISSPF